MVLCDPTVYIGSYIKKWLNVKEKCIWMRLSNSIQFNEIVYGLWGMFIKQYARVLWLLLKVI